MTNAHHSFQTTKDQSAPAGAAVIATRKSPLALWQAREVARILKQHHVETTEYHVVTSGDKLQQHTLATVHLATPPGSAGHLAHHQTGKGLFVKEIQEALLEGTAQIAVHSMKDLPIENTPGLIIAGLLPRAPLRDVLILAPRFAHFTKLPFHEMCAALRADDDFCSLPVGTVSARRVTLLQTLLGPHFFHKALRGNVDTRLRKLRDHHCAALVLAEAGIRRLGLWDDSCMIPLPTDTFLPAPAQGIVCIEVPESQKSLGHLLAQLTPLETLQEALFERLFLWAVGGDCQTALGVTLTENEVLLLVKDSAKGFDLCKPFALSAAERNVIFNDIHKNHSTFSDDFSALLRHPVTHRLTHWLQQEQRRVAAPCPPHTAVVCAVTYDDASSQEPPLPGVWPVLKAKEIPFWHKDFRDNKVLCEHFDENAQLSNSLAIFCSPRAVHFFEKSLPLIAPSNTQPRWVAGVGPATTLALRQLFASQKTREAKISSTVIAFPEHTTQGLHGILHHLAQGALDVPDAPGPAITPLTPVVILGAQGGAAQGTVSSFAARNPGVFPHCFVIPIYELVPLWECPNLVTALLYPQDQSSGRNSNVVFYCSSAQILRQTVRLLERALGCFSAKEFPQGLCFVLKAGSAREAAREWGLLDREWRP